jgi:hypothetical protein
MIQKSSNSFVFIFFIFTLATKINSQYDCNIIRSSPIGTPINCAAYDDGQPIGNPNNIVINFKI